MGLRGPKKHKDGGPCALERFTFQRNLVDRPLRTRRSRPASLNLCWPKDPPQPPPSRPAARSGRYAAGAKNVAERNSIDMCFNTALLLRKRRQLEWYRPSCRSVSKQPTGTNETKSNACDSWEKNPPHCARSLVPNFWNPRGSGHGSPATLWLRLGGCKGGGLQRLQGANSFPASSKSGSIKTQDSPLPKKQYVDVRVPCSFARGQNILFAQLV